MATAGAPGLKMVPRPVMLQGGIPTHRFAECGNVLPGGVGRRERATEPPALP